AAPAAKRCYRTPVVPGNATWSGPWLAGKADRRAAARRHSELLLEPEIGQRDLAVGGDVGLPIQAVAHTGIAEHVEHGDVRHDFRAHIAEDRLEAVFARLPGGGHGRVYPLVQRGIAQRGILPARPIED